MTPSPAERHVVLVAPEIHWNTGNIGRTCVGVGAALHLIKPLGFSLEDSRVKRAGLDYWPRVKLHVWEDFNRFREDMAPAVEEVALFTKSGSRPFWEMRPADRMFLLFGSETWGLPQEILSDWADRTYHIPITSQIRSLNLSTAAGIALYESLRNARSFHGWSND
jgi:tRNA (cytidine/uridine-2'-O-)-methyltransferase